jgi:hypothetical protein
LGIDAALIAREEKKEIGCQEAKQARWPHWQAHRF